MSTIAEFEERFPGIPWREPLKVTTTSGDWGYACRMCVAIFGLRGESVYLLPQDPAAVARHVAEEHPE